MTYLTESRDALAEALEVAIYADAEGVDPHERAMLPRAVADALITSGVVVAADTLAEPLCRNICDLLGEPRVLVPGEVSALLARTLAERGQ